MYLRKMLQNSQGILFIQHIFIEPLHCALEAGTMAVGKTPTFT